MNKILKTFLRMLAVFLVSALSVIGAGSLVDISVIQGILMAGILGVFSVIEEICRAFLEDGRLTYKELDEIFSKASKKD
jgi:hypothetical protein